MLHRIQHTSLYSGRSTKELVNHAAPSSGSFHILVRRCCNARRSLQCDKFKGVKRSPVISAAQTSPGRSSAPRFSQVQGPYAVSSLPVLNIPLGPSPIDPTSALQLQLEVLTPQSRFAVQQLSGLTLQRALQQHQQYPVWRHPVQDVIIASHVGSHMTDAAKPRCPVVLFTPGFLLNSSLYRSYATRLASWGYTCVLWDLSDVLDDTLTIAYMKQVMDVCSKDPRLKQYCDCDKLLLMGHSRGAKLSCLLADQDPRVQGLCLIDPVDNSSFGPQGVGYPSALPALQSVAAKRQLPVLIVGAALNTDVVPVEANWRRFAAAVTAGRAPVWEVVLKGSSHLQFLDKQMPLFAMFSNNGPTPDEVVREITQTCMVAFSQLALCPVSTYSSAQVQTLLAEEGEALKGLAPLECSLQNICQLRTASPAGSSSSYAPAGDCSSSEQQAGRSRTDGAGYTRTAATGRAKPVQASYSQLMNMRAKELKRLLQEHGVDSSDCFEKEELVKRVLEKCTLAA